MRPLLDFHHKEDQLRKMVQENIEGKKPTDDEVNDYIIQAYKLSKRKEAALDELTEEGINMFSPQDQDPRTILLKRGPEKPPQEGEVSAFERQ